MPRTARRLTSAVMQRINFALLTQAHPALTQTQDAAYATGTSAGLLLQVGDTNSAIGSSLVHTGKDICSAYIRTTRLPMTQRRPTHIITGHCCCRLQRWRCPKPQQQR